MRIETRQEARPRWAAASGVVKLSESQTVRGPCVQIGCMDFAPVATEVGKPHIVAEDDDEVWT